MDYATFDAVMALLIMAALALVMVVLRLALAYKRLSEEA